MHRDEAIYARSDARAGITLTSDEARIVQQALRFEADCYLGRVYPVLTDDFSRRAAQQRLDLAARLEAASTTPSP